MGQREGLSIVVACDLALLREGLVRYLRDAIAGDVIGFSTRDKRTIAEDPDVVLYVADPRLADIDASLGQISDEYPRARLCCMFLNDDKAAIVTALRAGARGIIDDALREDFDLSEVSRAVKRVAAGFLAFSADLAIRLAQQQDEKLVSLPGYGKASSLTPREQEVLRLLADGSNSRVIADRLALSEHTVRSHLRGIMQKLEVTNRAQAVALAWKSNLINIGTMNQGLSNGDSRN